MTSRRISTIAIALIAVTAVTACSDDTDGRGSVTTATDASAPAGTASAEAVVNIADSRFDQLELRVEPGTTVTFVNTDPFGHTVTSQDASPVDFDSGDLGQDETFEFTFDEPGEYPYFCQIHPTMRAVVIVE